MAKGLECIISEWTEIIPEISTYLPTSSKTSYRQQYAAEYLYHDVWAQYKVLLSKIL